MRRQPWRIARPCCAASTTFTGMRALARFPIRSRLTRLTAAPSAREHVPDFLAHTRTGRWLIDVRPAARVGERDRVAFAASAEVALLHGWRYLVVSGWKPHVLTTVDTLSVGRRPLT